MMGWAALDWDLRTRVPTFLRAANLDAHAELIASLAPIVDVPSLLLARQIAAGAALAAHAEWQDRKPPMGTPECDAARTAAMAAAEKTALPCSVVAGEALREVHANPWAFVVAGDLENAARWSAAAIACGGGDLVMTTARLDPVVREVEGKMPSWR
jgi:hypothetical protein